MKDKKGFTLVELIAVIVIACLMISLTSVAIYNVQKNVLEKDYDNLVTYLETKAAEYASKTNVTTVSVEELIEAGYVQPDDQTDVYNPKDKTSMNCYILKSTFVDGEYVAELKEDLGTENGVCKSYESTSDFAICKLDTLTGKCDVIKNSDWFKDDITLAVKYQNGEIITKEEETEFNWSSTRGESSKEYTIVASAASVSQNTYKVEVTMGNIKGEASQIINIDKQAPSIVSGNVDTGWASKKVLTVEATDMAGSGIKGYAFPGLNETCKDYSSSNTHEYTVEGTYNYCVMDNAGNVSTSLVTIEKIDTFVPVKPTITPSDGIPQEKWHLNNFTLKFTSVNEKSISEIKYYYGTSRDNLNVVGSEVLVDINYNGKTIYVKACNEAGTCSEVNSYKVRYDNTPPTYTSGGSLGNGSISKPTYTDNNGGSGNVTVYVCATSGNAPTYGDACFNTGTTFSTSCGTTYKLYSYAVDEAGNKSAIYDHYAKNNVSYYRACSSSSGGGSHSSGSSNTSKEPSCDITCQMQKNSEAWWDCTTDSCRKDLEDKNKNLADKNTDCKGDCTLTHDGEWLDSNGKPLYGDSGGNKTGSGSSSGSSNKGGSSSGSSNKGSSSGSSSSNKGSSSSGSSSGGKVCLVENTKVTLADGSEKNIQDIGYDDLLKVWSYEQGRFVYEYPIWIEKEGTSEEYQKTTFSDGTVLNTVGDHSIYSMDANAFVSVTDRDNFKIGTRVAKYNNNEIEVVTVDKIEFIEKNVKYYYVASTRYYNIISNNIITADGLTLLSNLYGFDNMKWPSVYKDFVNDKNNLYTKQELELPDYLYYGLRAYEAKRFKDILPLEMFKVWSKENLLNEQMIKLPITDNHNNRLWKVTTSNDFNFKNKSLMYTEGSVYRLPFGPSRENQRFVGWYNMADGKMYKENELVRVVHGMHFEAVWEGI